MKTMNKNLKIKALALAAIGSLMALPAFAQWTVNVNSDVSTLSIERNVSLVGINGELATMNAQLVSTDAYLQGGYNGGNGLLPLLSSINEKLGKSNSSAAQQESNSDMSARNRMYEQQMIDLKVSATPTQADFKRACVAISSRLTSAQGHGAARGSADAFRGAREVAIDREKRYKTASTPTQRLADVARGRNAAGFCSEDDLKNGYPGCTEEGDLPNADIRSSSLTVGATASPTDPTNGSLDARQVAAARAYIVNTSPMPPTIPDKGVLETSDGKAFLAQLDRFSGRSSAAGDAMGNILAAHTAIPLTVNGAAEQSGIARDWQERKGDWQDIFGNKLAFPANPSERDFLRYEVFRYYVSPEYARQLQTTADSRGIAALQREMIIQQALQNRIQFETLQRLEDLIKIQAQMLNHHLEPMTADDLERASTAAGR